jgi:hypothetical protein
MTAPQDEAVSSRQGAWHQSTLDLIGSCSWRYFLTYGLGLPDPSGEAAITGTAVHAAVEAHEKNRMAGGPGLTLEQMHDMVTAELGDNEQGRTGRLAVTHWWKGKFKDKSMPHREWVLTMTPVAIEPYFRTGLVDGAMPIGGWMDAVYLDENGMYRIVDLKTANSMSRWKDSGEGKRHQATVYSVAIQLGAVLDVSLDYLPEVTYTVVRTTTGTETAKRVHVTPDLEDVRVLGDKIREAQRIVNEEDYAKNPAWNLCSQTWCPHYQGCMVTGELSGTPATVRSRLSQEKAYGPYNTDNNKILGGITQ